MGTATPRSGQIAFSDLNTGILNAGSTASLNMNTAAVRMGYSSTGQVSLSQLRGCSGGTFTIGYVPPSKFISGFYGYSAIIGPAGSITGEIYQSPFRITDLTQPDSVPSSTRFYLSSGSPNFTAPTSPWRASDITRACIADAVRSGTGADDTTYNTNFNMPTSGTLTWGLKFG
jgi:hypothetical protein